MNIKDKIELFQIQLQQEVDAHETMLQDWDSLDWHDRYVNIERLLHRMWALYDRADELSEYMRITFPPYPFSEIKSIKVILKQALHRMKDFLEEDYHSSDTSDYQKAYMSFLSVICKEEHHKAWKDREAFIADKEQELLTMLQQSYSVILDLLISTSLSGKNDTKAIQLSYANALARYEQVYWNKDEKQFQTRLETKYPWDDGPTAGQLKDFYATLSDELLQNPCGKAYLQHRNDRNKLALAIAKQQPTEEQLLFFFRRTHELEHLQSHIDILKKREAQILAEGKKELSSLEQTFTYIYRKNQAYPLLIDFLQEEKKKKGRSADADWARHALVIYDQKPTILQHRPNSFTTWLHKFCELFDREWVRDYEPQKLRNTNKKSDVERFMPVKNIG